MAIGLINRLLLHKEEIIILYKEGCSPQNLGEKFGFSEMTITKYLKLWDIKLRNMYESHQIWSRKLKNYDYFDIIDTEKKAYWLGFIYADGNISSKNHVFQIGLSLKDQEHLQKFASIFNKIVKIYINKNSLDEGMDGFRAILNIGNYYLYHSLINIGIKPRKTYSDDYSVWNNIPKELKRHFLRGFMDGDGCIGLKKRHYKSQLIITFYGRKFWIDEISQFLSNQIKIHRKKAQKHWEDLYRIDYEGNNIAKKVCNYLYHDSELFLHRKYKVFMEAN